SVQVRVNARVSEYVKTTIRRLAGEGVGVARVTAPQPQELRVIDVAPNQIGRAHDVIRDQRITPGDAETHLPAGIGVKAHNEIRDAGLPAAGGRAEAGGIHWPVFV